MVKNDKEKSGLKHNDLNKAKGGLTDQQFADIGNEATKLHNLHGKDWTNNQYWSANNKFLLDSGYVEGSQQYQNAMKFMMNGEGFLNFGK